MATNEDIIKALKAEKNKIMASAIKPQMSPNISNAEIVENMIHQAKPGKGGQKIAGDSRMGSPTSTVNIEDTIDLDNVFNIPGLKEALKNERKR